MQESLFSVTQTLVMVAWGQASDRFGRKPVLVFSLACVAVSHTLFGFATAIWQMVLFRCLSGVFAGTVVTLRAMFTEISTPKTQARAFSFFAFASNLGIFLGPLMGGGLANPTKTYPNVFGHIQLFKSFPYALPTIVCGSFAASASLLSALFVKETLQVKKDGEDGPKPMSSWEILKSPGVSRVLGIYSIIMMTALGYTASKQLSIWYIRKSLKEASPSSLLVYRCQSRRFWLVTTDHIAFPRSWRLVTIIMAIDHLPSFATSSRYR